MTSAELFEFLFKWQTLIAGLIALAAAARTIEVMQEQLRQAAQHERERQERRFAADRLSLSFVLDAYTDHLEKRARLLVGLVNGMLASRQGSINFVDFERFKMEIDGPLYRLVEHRAHPISRYLTKLINFEQVTIARINSGKASADHSRIFNDAMSRLVQLHAATQSLYWFARDETNDLPTSRMIAPKYQQARAAIGYEQSEVADYFAPATTLTTDLFRVGRCEIFDDLPSAAQAPVAGAS